jgi:hypothetical protein
MTRDILEPTPSAKSSQTSPMDEKGRRERDTANPEPPVYGEPKGPRPPHFDVLPKDEIERRARGGVPVKRAEPEGPRSETAERQVGGFVSGMTTPETFQTTGDQGPAVVRRDLAGDILPEDADGRERPER